MAKRTRIDELNILRDAFDREDYIAHYFDTMQITQKQKKERIEEAEDLFDAVLLFLIWCAEDPANVQLEDTQREMCNLYKEVVFQHTDPSDYIDVYVPVFIGNLVEVTVKSPDDPYATSVQRATIIACNEANTISNYTELIQAKELGYTHKQWIAELDKNTRGDHIEMDGEIVPIEDYFYFPDCKMLMPHDEVNGTAKQCSNCRCSLEFLDLW